MEGMKFLRRLDDDAVPAAFFDPQYRGVLDKLKYGNEGKSRGKAQHELPPMSQETINQFICEISRVLIPSGHLFLWMDKFHLCTGFSSWLSETQLTPVDMVTWFKERIGMGYRTRRSSEYVVILQKHPIRAKGVWTVHNIPDVWTEKPLRRAHTHQKPVDLQSKLIEAVTDEGDLVIDPAAGSFSVLDACLKTNRVFLGCDLNGSVMNRDLA